MAFSTGCLDGGSRRRRVGAQNGHNSRRSPRVSVHGHQRRPRAGGAKAARREIFKEPAKLPDDIADSIAADAQPVGDHVIVVYKGHLYILLDKKVGERAVSRDPAGSRDRSDIAPTSVSCRWRGRPSRRLRLWRPSAKLAPDQSGSGMAWFAALCAHSTARSEIAFRSAVSWVLQFSASKARATSGVLMMLSRSLTSEVACAASCTRSTLLTRPVTRLVGSAIAIPLNREISGHDADGCHPELPPDILP